MSNSFCLYAMQMAGEKIGIKRYQRTAGAKQKRPVRSSC